MNQAQLDTIWLEQKADPTRVIDDPREREFGVLAVMALTDTDLEQSMLVQPAQGVATYTDAGAETNDGTGAKVYTRIRAKKDADWGPWNPSDP